MTISNIDDKYLYVGDDFWDALLVGIRVHEDGLVEGQRSAFPLIAHELEIRKGEPYGTLIESLFKDGVFIPDEVATSLHIGDIIDPMCLECRNRIGKEFRLLMMHLEMSLVVVNRRWYSVRLLDIIFFAAIKDSLNMLTNDLLSGRLVYG